MSEPKWIRGPWVVGHDPRQGMEWNKWIKAGRGNICVLSQNHAGESPVTVANAHLIAAAPDLYADLFALVDYAKKKRIFRDDMGQGVEAHCNLVLAKARGEQP